MPDLQPLSLTGIPDEWLSDAAKLLSAQEIPEKQIATTYDRVHEYISACATISGNFAALKKLCFYIVHEQKIFKAKFGTWNEYCSEMSHAGHGSVATIKADVTAIKKLVEAHGANLRTTILALASAPIATRELADKAPDELNQPANELLEKFGGQTGTEAYQELKEATGEPTIACIHAAYLQKEELLLFKLVVKPNSNITEDSKEHDLTIPDVKDVEIAKWLGGRLHPKDGLVIKP